ncbi:MAG: tRNA pseudouridine(55) synthase TruB [Bacteroidales bacterium]|nr:tRNA pseudouridine(55) synthase TruB [Bacteroidales bacterium]
MKIYDFEAGEVLAFDKPLHWTSFNLVKIVRNNLSRRLGVKKLKVGHAGTLDPLASGVMIICTGKATKQIDQLQAGTKEYIATLRLGCTTASFDAEHPVDATFPTAHITREMVEEGLKKFLGSIWQVPPVYSACKVEGRRAFDYVRQGEEVELKAKELVIDEIEMLDLHLPEQGIVSPHAQEVVATVREGVNIKEGNGRKQLLEHAEQGPVEEKLVEVTPEDCPYLQIRVVCSKGTYIRALARDIGQALGSGAYLIGLRRTRVGNISIEDCLAASDVEKWAAEVPIVEKENNV